MKHFVDDMKDYVSGKIGKHPDLLKILTDTKDKEGKSLFDTSEIDAILLNCRDTNNSDEIIAILSNPEEIDIISSRENKVGGLWRAVDAPLQSTIDKNPEAFGYKPKKEQITENSSNTSFNIVAKKLEKGGR